MADKIKEAYQTSKNIYDDVLTQGSLFSRMYIKWFWSGTDDNEIARKVLDFISDNFEGTILDVPVGTAVFTEKKWKPKRTDWLVKNILSKKGWFTPPFQTEEELKSVIEEKYRDVEFYVDGSIVYFKCVK